MTTHRSKRSVRLSGSYKLAVLLAVAVGLSGGISNSATAAIPLESAAAIHPRSIQPAPAKWIAVAAAPDRPLLTETQPTVNISTDAGLYRGVVQLLFAGLIVWIIALLRGGK